MAMKDCYATTCKLHVSETLTELEFGVCQNDEGNANMELALKNPTMYVLKPQREGGGKLWSLVLAFVNSFYYCSC